MLSVLLTTWIRWKTSRTVAAAILLICIAQHFMIVEGSDCPASFSQSVNCSCTRIGFKQYDLLCPKSQYPYNSYVLKADIVENESVTISCTVVKSPADLTLVSGLNLGPIHSFMIKLCPLPDMSFKDLMLSMGIKQIKKLQIQLVSNISTIERRHLAGLNEITQIDLSLNGLMELPEDLFNDMSNLTWLTLINNNINRLPKGIFKHLPKLDVLDLGNNNITYLEPGIFRNLSQLRLLNLWNNKIANLTRAVFSDTPNLEMLDLRSNSLVTLTPDVFTDLAKLKTVNINGNMISILPSGLFSSNTFMKEFALTNNKKQLNTFPQGFLSNLKYLREIQMIKSNIMSIPKDLIWDSSAVTKIQLQENFLRELPELLFRNSSELIYVDISNNKLETLPNAIFRSTRKLTTLIAHHNQLTFISSELLAHLSELTTLDLSKNKLADIDSEAFFGNQNLQIVKFSNNYLTFFNASDPFAKDPFGPSSPFKHCLKIKELHLANNSITHIFFDWRGASNLMYLDLKYNKISYLEAEDINFRGREKLEVDLSYNNISVIELKLVEIIALAPYETEIKPHYQNPLENHSAKIHLAGNPLQCDCKNYYLKRYFNDELTPEVKYIIDLDPSNLKCAGPKPLEGMLFSEIPSDSVMCEIINSEQITSICPNKCACFYRPADKGFIIDCRNRNISTLSENFLLRTIQSIRKNLNSLVNHTHLDLSDNQIISLPKELDEGFQNVTELQLSSNKISSIDLSELSPNLTVLKLDNNNMSYFNSESVHFLSNAHQLQSVFLNNNPWHCDCKARDFLNFIQKFYDKVPNLQNVTCVGGKEVSEITLNDICPGPTLAVMITSIVVAVLSLIIGLLSVLYYRYNQEIKVWLYAHQICLWFVTEEEIDRDKLYDAFVSFSHQDEEFVMEHIVPGLEEGNPQYKLCLHYRDWVVGDYIPTQIARSVDNSRRTIVILSPNFLESVWGKMEFRTAHSQALSEGRARVIVILYGDIGPTDNLDPELKAYISMNTYIKWGDPWFWDRLRFALPHPPKEAKGIPLFQRNIAREQNRPVLYIDKDDLIKGTDPNTTPPATTTPPANSFINETPSLIPNGKIKLEETSINCERY